MIRAYSAEDRHYHNLKHIEDCLALLDCLEGLSRRDREILTSAIWWHDIVYDPRRSDNEELSARMAEEHVAPALRQEVGRLIRLTKSHHSEPGDRLGAIMISIDLSILAAAAPIYDGYALAIRREYGHVPDAAYRAGRAAVLEQFAARSVIYPESSFAAKFDEQARANLARELASLRS